MKFSIERAALLRGLSRVQSVVERRNTVPILSNVMLTAGGDGLSLTATDMDLEIRDVVPATVEAPGVATVPAHTLYDIARKLRDTALVSLELAADGASVAVKSGRSSFTLPALPAGDYPIMAGGDMPCAFAVPAKDLARLLARTRFAMSTEETRYYLNGVHLHAVERDGVAALRAVATDGHRLSRAEVPLPEGAATIPPVIVPRKAVIELGKLLDKEEGDIEVAVSATKIRFGVAGAVMTSKLVDGAFPDYERVIPQNNTQSLRVDAALLAEAVDRVSTISTEKSRAVRFAIAPGVVTLSSASAETGSATEEVEASFAGEAMEVGFNARYLLDILQQADGGEFEFRLDNPAAPAILVDGSDGSALYVLMPMRV